MNKGAPSFARTYAILVVVAFVPGLFVAVVASLIVSARTVELGVASVLAGCGISWLASCGGAIPVAFALVARTAQPANAILGSTAIRFLVVLACVVPAVLLGPFNRTILVCSVAASYLLMLLVDTVYATRAMRRLCGGES